MANTIPLKTVFAREYQRTHFKKAVYPLFADMRFEDILSDGATVDWAYDDDAVADSLDASDGYTLENKTVTNETITVNQKPSHGFRIPASQRIQDHRPTQEKWARKAMNVIFQKIDGDVLKDLRDGAATTLDNSSFGGSSGDPITVTSSNAAAIFAAAQRLLTNNNVIYDENKAFTNNVMLDGGDRFPVAAIPAELKEQLLLQIGFKNTDYADKTLKSGFMGPLFGFNACASTSLPFSFRLTQTATPTDATTITLGSGSSTIGSGTSLAFTWKTTIGATAGNVLAVTNGTTSITNLVALINAPTVTTANGVAFTRSALSKAQRRIFDNMSAVDNLDGSCVITISGYGTRTVAQTDTAGAIDRQTVHAIFGVSKSIAVIMQRMPGLAESAGELITTGELTGFVGKHFVCWGLYGRKVFKTHQPQIINVKIAASAYAQPASVLN